MKFTLARVKELTERDYGPTGDSFLDARYDDYAALVGHGGNPYYRMFFHLTRELKPALSVELGSYRGDAAANLAAGNPGGQVVTMDPHREDRDAQRLCREAAAHYSNLFYWNGWSWELAEMAAGLGRPVDLLFVDAWHEYRYAIREWELYLPLLSDEALVICDDVYDDPTGATLKGMVKFYAEVSAPFENFVEDKMHCGIPMGYIRYVRRND